MYYLDPFTRHTLERGSAHLHRLGDRAIAEFLAEISARIGGLPAVLQILGEYEERLTPEMVRLVGGDRFQPMPLRVVPR
jgi:hypothetical protein